MTALDGHYRHDGTAMVWDVVGVSLAHLDEGSISHASWEAILGARQIGVRPGRIQILVRGHIPPGDAHDDPFSIGVASDDDAKRLITHLEWNVSSFGTERVS